jgi:hypothetical protein
MNKSIKRCGGLIAGSALLGGVIGFLFDAPIVGAVTLSLLSAAGLFLLSKLRLGPM